MWNEKTVAHLVTEASAGSERVGPRKVRGPCKRLQEAGEGEHRRDTEDQETGR
jgi:hypothetical protein